MTDKIISVICFVLCAAVLVPCIYHIYTDPDPYASSAIVDVTSVYNSPIYNNRRLVEYRKGFFVDRVTGVIYVKSFSGYGLYSRSSLTPLLDSDGKPVIYSEGDIN